MQSVGMATGLDKITCMDELSLDGKRVFLRLDLNVPLRDGEIKDETRIRACLPTIRYILDHGGKLVVGSHLGRPKGEEDRQKLSLEPVAKRLGELLEIEVFLMEDILGQAPQQLLNGLRSSQIIMLENLRFVDEEIKNSQEMAVIIASYIDIYINDAFGACHRAHGSISALAKEVEQRVVGFLIRKEVEMLDQVIYQSTNPFVVILGGSKVSDKIGVFENLMEKVDTFIVGGAMAYTFLKAKGVSVGDSLVERDYLTFAKEIIRSLETRGKKLLLPVDHIVAENLNAEETARINESENIERGWMGLDIGPRSTELFIEEISKAKTIFWNGPMGVFEKEVYSKGTFSVAQAVADNGGLTVVGGGDSVAATNAAGVADKMTHISTGGGASLEYLQGDKLPGLEALRKTGREGVTPTLS